MMKRRRRQRGKRSNFCRSLARKFIESERAILIQRYIAPIRGIEADATHVLAACPFVSRFNVRQDKSGGGLMAQLSRDADLGCLPNRQQALETLAHPTAGSLGGGSLQ